MAFITEATLRAMLAKGIPNPFPVAAADRLTPAAADFLKSRHISIVRTQIDLTIPVGVSNRHVHLSPLHVELLFGHGHALTSLRELSQKGQYAANETVEIMGPKGSFSTVRVLGPARGATQIEISRTDGFQLGVHPPVRLSGDLQGTPGLIVKGPYGRITLEQGVIIAHNHLHISPVEAEQFGVSEGERLLLQAQGERPLIFADVIVRINERFTLDFHIDIDEANAAGLKTGDRVKLAGKSLHHLNKERGRGYGR